MASLQFRGDAPARAQVTRVTPANVETGDVFTLTVGGKQVSYTAAAASVADVTAGLAQALAEAEHPEMKEITAEDESTWLLLTATAPGKPFTVTAETTDGGGTDDQTLTVETLVSSGGPHHWDDPANWSTGSLPADGDDVHIEQSAVPLRYGLDQSAVTLASLHIAASYTGEVGLPRIDRDGEREYFEYRPRYLAISAAEVRIGEGRGDGSSRVQIDLGDSAAAVTVLRTAPPLERDLPAVLLTGLGAASELSVADGEVGVAPAGGAAAALDVLRHSGGEVRIGSGTAVTGVHRSGEGRLTLHTGATTLEQSSGETIVLGEGGIGELRLLGGRVDYRATGTVGEATIDGPDAVLDFSADLRPRTVSACLLRRGAIFDPHQTVSWGSGVQIERGVEAG